MISPPVGARIHLIGIAGTAMGALAGLLQNRGYLVTGSDAEIYPPISTLLEQLGVIMFQGYRARNLDAAPGLPPPELVVIGNALSRGNEEVEEVLDRKLRYASLPEVMRELFLDGRETIVVAGTHGKTTVTSLLSWIFHFAGLQPGFMIGGVPRNFPHGFERGSGRHFIIEGDEYDTAFFDKGPKFLHYRPDAVLLTSVEFDHADIYADLAAVKLSFQRLIHIIPRRGLLVAAAESENVRELAARALCTVETFGFSDGDWRAGALHSTDQFTTFEVTHRGSALGPLTIRMFGRHNVANALAAAAMANRYGIDWGVIQSALLAFEGVRRRMEIVGEAAGVTVVDDFAHHPTAIRETLLGARARFRGRRIWALLEPRSNTLRRNVFEKELVDALCNADRVILAGVYRSDKIPAAERLDPAKVVEGVRARGIPAEFTPDIADVQCALLSALQPGDIVLTMSNGGFGGIQQKLMDALNTRAARGDAVTADLK